MAQPILEEVTRLSKETADASIFYEDKIVYTDKIVDRR